MSNAQIHLPSRQLFAWQKVQQDATPGIAQLRDRFSAPRPQPLKRLPALRLAQHHIIRPGHDYADKQIRNHRFARWLPAHQPEQQGEFVLGYYHQRQAF